MQLDHPATATTTSHGGCRADQFFTKDCFKTTSTRSGVPNWLRKTVATRDNWMTSCSTCVTRVISDNLELPPASEGQVTAETSYAEAVCKLSVCGGDQRRARRAACHKAYPSQSKVNVRKKTSCRQIKALKVLVLTHLRGPNTYLAAQVKPCRI